LSESLVGGPEGFLAPASLGTTAFWRSGVFVKHYLRHRDDVDDS
jgi:hypothetical protein